MSRWIWMKGENVMKIIVKLTIALLLAACVFGTGFSSRIAAASDGGEHVNPEATTTLLILPQISPASTVPGNGDVNPYGVVFVPSGFHTGGALNPGDILVSNFNNSNNEQGTGTTIVRIQPNGQTSPFFQSTVPGLSTALGIVDNGFIVVGNVPTQDGTCGTLGTGSLQVINYKDQLIQTIHDPEFLDSPWDMTIVNKGQNAIIFVSNVVSGTVTRLNVLVNHGLHIQSKVQIASGYSHSCTASTFVIGPTGLAYDQSSDTLFVRPTGHLLGSNGHAVNGDPNQPSEIVEFTTGGTFVSEFSVDPGQGGAFGMNFQSVGGGFFRFAAVDDVTNSLRMFTVTQ